MTTKKSPDRIKWTEETETAFKTLRSALSANDFLLAPDQSKPFILATDASYKGVGAVLSQHDAQERERPVAYFSKKLEKYQLNYTVTELELLAIVLAVQHFSIWVCTSHCKQTTEP